MTEKDIQEVEDAFAAAIERCKKAGCKIIFVPQSTSRLKNLSI
jgi:2,4-dienoyl-CoA reductase-like NADH-dependent reductase (Old Yellow Enzyme family)